MSVVITLSTGNTKKKPMTKKEREKKKTQGKTLENVVPVVVHHPFLENSANSRARALLFNHFIRKYAQYRATTFCC